MTTTRSRIALLQEHSTRVLDVFLDFDKELDCFSTVQKTVVVGECQIHHGADFNLAIDSNWALLDGVETKDR